jgi:hypothetical protein
VRSIGEAAGLEIAAHGLPRGLSSLGISILFQVTYVISWVNPPDNAHIPEARIQKLELEKKEKNPPPEAAGMPPHSREGSKQESAAAAPPGFDVFWEAYPKKASKPAALRAFKAAVKKVSFTEMMAALERQKPTWNPDYIKNPATWLNNECWNDQLAKKPEWSNVL